MKLDLNDLEIDVFDFDEDQNRDLLSEGHGLTEIGASCPASAEACNQGSCRVQEH
jgi:hypothetical protein